MFGLLIFVHVIIGVLLVVVILLQSGRSSGLTETFGSAAESLFGTKTNAFMIRATTTLAILFIVSCLGLAYMSKQQSKSLMERVKSLKVQEQASQKAASGEPKEIAASPVSVSVNETTNTTQGPKE